MLASTIQSTRVMGSWGLQILAMGRSTTFDGRPTMGQIALDGRDYLVYTDRDNEYRAIQGMIEVEDVQRLPDGGIAVRGSILMTLTPESVEYHGLGDWPDH